MSETVEPTPDPPRERSGAGRARPGAASAGTPLEPGEAGIAALACVLGLVRFARLGAPSLWFDEVATWTDAHHGLAAGQIANPLGYHLIAAVARLLGPAPDELALRLLPALAGWLVVPLTWRAFRPLAGGRRAAFAALLIALSAWQLGWSQTARFYTLAQLCGLGAGAAWLRALLGEPLPLLGRSLSPRAGMLAALAAALALLALGAAFHPSTLLLAPAFVLAPFALRVLGLRPPRVATRPSLLLLALAVAGGLAAAPWAWRTWSTYDMQKGAGSMLASLAHTLKATGYNVTPWLGAAALAGAVLAWWRRERWLALCTLVPVLVLAQALLLALLARVAAQYVLVALPWVALAAAAPLASPRERSTERAPLARLHGPRAPNAGIGLAYALVLVLASAVQVGLYLSVRQGERPPWREAFALVERERGPNDLVLAMEASVAQHYLDPGRTWLREVEDVAWFDLYRSRRYARWTPHARRTWFVLNPEQLAGWAPEEAEDLRHFLREECHLAAAFPLYVESRDLSVWVWVR